MTVELMSKSAYARHRGCDEKAVRQAILQKRISLIDGKIDPEVADIQWAKNTRARADSGRSAASVATQQGGSSGNGEKCATGPDSKEASGLATEPAADKTGYHDFRTRRESAEAERAELEVAKIAGRLVDRETTERAVFDAFRALRDAALSVPARAAPKLLGMAEIRDVEHVISEELRKTFEGWEARMLERLEIKDAA